MPVQAASLLRRIASAFGSEPAAQSPRDLPMSTPEHVRRRWAAQLPDATALLAGLRQQPDMNYARARLQERGIEIGLRSQSGSIRVERSTDLGSGFPVTYPRSGLSVVAPGAVIGATPDRAEAFVQVLACLQHRIQRIVELDSADERLRTPSGMDVGCLRGKGADIDLACCYGSKSGETEPEPIVKSPRILQDCGPEVTVSTLRATLSRRRAPEAGPKDGGLAQGHAEITAPKPGRLLIMRIQVPLEPDQAIRPDLLQAVTSYLGVAEDGGMGRRPTLFQSLDGDRRAAVLAAALQIHDVHNRGGLCAGNLRHVVEAACQNVLIKRNPDLITDPADVASLLAFGDLLLEEARELKLKPAALQRVAFVPTVIRLDLAEDEIDEGSGVESDQDWDDDSDDDQSSGSDIASSR